MRPARRPKLRILGAVLVGLVSAFFLARVVFLLGFEGWRAIHEPGVGRALYLGLKFDARLAALLVAPAWLLLRPGGGSGARRGAGPGPWLLASSLAVYLLLVLVAMVDDRAARPWLLAFLALAAAYRFGAPDHGLADRSGRWIWGAFAGGLAFALGLAYLADAGTYAYIHTRLNGTLLMFLENPGTSLRMVWESYPFLRLALALLLLTAGTLWGLRRAVRGLAPLDLPAWPRRGVHGLASLGLVLLMWGKASAYPLRWSEAFEAPRAFHAHLALNPALFFLETRRDMDGGFDLAQVKATHGLMARYFGIPEAVDAEGLPTLLRTQAPRRQVPEGANLVLIQLESLAGYKTGVLGNPLKPTPFLDRLAAEGIFFDRFHVAMENTSRSMFATLTGIPDVSAVENATRNPLLLDQHSALSVFPEYRKAYFLGGSANWAQMRGILKHTFPDLSLYEEGSYAAPTVDVWGICDADLLREAQGVLAKTPEPRWAYIQTSGNHPPFTIPKHLRGFRVESRTPAELAAAGFESLEEYNAVRLMDHSLELFFQEARKDPAFDRTVFVLWADHGISRGMADTRFGDLALGVHHIPCVIYAPKLLAPRRVHTIGTQMDLLPTLASLLGRPLAHRTLGKDLLDPAWEDRAAAFTFTTFRRPPRIGLRQGDWYLTVEPDGREALYRLDEAVPKDHRAAEPARAAEMKALAQGFHQWSKFLLTHNKPIGGAP